MGNGLFYISKIFFKKQKTQAQARGKDLTTGYPVVLLYFAVKQNGR